MVQYEHRMPIEVRGYSDDFRRVCSHPCKHKNFRSRSLQDRYVRVEMLICDIVGDVDPDHPGDVTEPVFQPLEQFSTEMIVLPKSYDPFSGVEGLYVVGVDAPLFPNGGLPTHRPREQGWIAQMVVSGRDKELRNL